MNETPASRAFWMASGHGVGDRDLVDDPVHTAGDPGLDEIDMRLDVPFGALHGDIDIEDLASQVGAVNDGLIEHVTRTPDG